MTTEQESHRLRLSLSCLAIALSSCGIVGGPRGAINLTPEANGPTHAPQPAPAATVAAAPAQPASAAPAAAAPRAEAKTDCGSYQPPRKTSGFEPLLLPDIPCALERQERLYLAVSCTTERLGRVGPYLFPGAEVVPQPPLLTGRQRGEIRVRTPDGTEEIVAYRCLSRVPLGASFVPREPPRDAEAALRTLMKQLYLAARDLPLEAYEIRKANGFGQVASGTREFYELETRSNAFNFYSRTLQNFVHGSKSKVETLLGMKENAWLAKWPDFFIDTYSAGLKGGARDGAEPAVDVLSARGSLTGFAVDYGQLRVEEEQLDNDLRRMSEENRARVKERRLDEIARKRKDIATHIDRALERAKKSATRVKL